MRTWALLILLMTPQAAVANEYLSKGRALYESLRFAEAIEQLRIAREVPTSSPAQTREVLDLLARCLIAEGEVEEAERALTELLTIDPSVDLDRALSPKILEVFDRVKERLYPKDYVRLRADRAPPGIARLQVVDPWRQVAQVRVQLQRGAAFVPVAARREQDAWVATLSDGSAPRVTWYAQAVDEAGKVVATLGTPEQPYVFDAVPSAALPAPKTPPSPGASSFRTRAAWGAVGVAVLAGAAGGVMQYRSQAALARYERAEWAYQRRSNYERATSDARWAAGLFVGAGALAASAAVMWTW